WLIVLLNLPALVIIILAYVWFGLNEAAAIGAVALNKIPNAIVTMREGARALDPDLDEMARAYRLSFWSKLRNVTLPQLQPYFAAASRSGISLIWKIVLVVELLGRPNGVGFELHLNFQLFNVTAILGYTVAFVTVMLAIEYLLVQPLERRTTRWRNKPACDPHRGEDPCRDGRDEDPCHPRFGARGAAAKHDGADGRVGLRQDHAVAHRRRPRRSLHRQGARA